MAKITTACLLSFLAMGLIGCSGSGSKQSEENPNVFPVDYKKEILFTMTTTLENSANVRGAFISEPILSPAGTDQRYVVCVCSDSRNANNQYTGSTDRIGYFYAGHLNQLIEATKEQCGNAAYKPFPELEKLCQAKKCM